MTAAGTGIGDIARSGMTPVSGGFTDNIKKEAAEMAAAGLDFSNLMSKNAGNFGEMPEKGDILRVNDTDATGKKNDFDRMTKTASRVKEADNNDLKIKKLSKEEKKSINETADKVKEEITEALGISEEELESACEALGLTLADLLDPQKLLVLIMDVKGGDDPASIITDPAVSGLIDTIGAIKNDLAQALDLPKTDPAEMTSELSALMEAAGEEFTESFTDEAIVSSADMPDENISVNVNGEQADPALVAENTDINEETVVQTTDTVTSEAAATVSDEDAKEIVKDASQTAERSVEAAKIPQEVRTDETAKPQEESAPEKETVVKAPADAKAGGEASDMGDGTGSAGSDDKNNMSSPQNSGRNTTVTHAEVHAGAAVHPGAGNEFSVNEMNMAPAQQFSYIDAADLIDQFSSLTRNYRTGDTTISMQLNPENLGNLTLDVTSDKAGAVSANIRVENEAVRDSLNAQLAEVRATLESAGIRVTSVEVTVETHEFEQAYENQRGAASTDMGGNGGNAPSSDDGNASGSQTRRNLNINNLDEIADNMTDEEKLAASIMRDNGGNVDFTA